MWVGISKALLTVVTIAPIYVRVATTSITVSVQVVFSFLYSCTKETVLGLQQVKLPSYLQNSEQASCAAEQLHLCQEHGLSLLQLQLIILSISERAAVTLVSEGYWPPFAPCTAMTACFVADWRHCVGWIALLSITSTDKMCGLLHDIVKASFLFTHSIPTDKKFNNLCLPTTMVATNCVASGNCMSCNQLWNDAGVLCHCCPYINGWSTAAGGVHNWVALTGFPLQSNGRVVQTHLCSSHMTFIVLHPTSASATPWWGMMT